MRYDMIIKVKQLMSRLNSDIHRMDLIEEPPEWGLARNHEKSHSWLEACEIYINWLNLNFEYSNDHLLKKFFICLARTDNFSHSLTIELGHYLLRRSFDVEILNLLLNKILLMGDSKQALNTFRSYYELLKQENLSDELKLTYSKILIKNQDYANAQIKLNRIKSDGLQLPNDLSLEWHLQQLDIFKLTKSIIDENFMMMLHKECVFDFEMRLSLAEYYFLKGELNLETFQLDRILQGQALSFKELKRYFASPLFKKEAKIIQCCRMFLENSNHQDEVQSIKILMATHLMDFEEACDLLEGLLKNYFDPQALVEKMYRIACVHKRSESISKYFKLIQLLANQRIDMPENIRRIFQEISQKPDDKLFLVGGSVISLISTESLQLPVDYDLIFNTNAIEIPNFVPSKYIPNLFVRDTKRLGGHAVDLKLIQLSDEAHFLEQDVSLRDFTICGIYCDVNGVIYDPTERGIFDLLNKRLDTICDPVKTLTSDPVRIIRAFKYMTRGFKPSDKLREALIHLPENLDLEKNPHFNKVLLKECSAIHCLHFFKVLKEFKFLKHLSYCYVLSDDLDERIIGMNLIKGLQNSKAIIGQETSRKINPDVLELVNHNKELSEEVAELSQVLSVKQEKLKRIETLRLQLAEQKKKNIALEKETKILVSHANQQLQSDIHKASKQQKKFIAEINSQIGKLESGLFLAYDKMCQLDNKLESKNEAIAINYERLNRLKDIYQSTVDSIALLQRNVVENFHPSPYNFDFLNLPPKSFKSYQSQSLEKMARVVSMRSLKAFLHIHIAIQELKKTPGEQNNFKIYNHIQAFMAFLPSNLLTVYEPIVQEILSSLVLPDCSEMKAHELQKLASDELKNLHIETAIFYYQQILHQLRRDPKNKIFLDAHYELAKIYHNQKDPLQLERIINLLLSIPKLPKEATKEINQIYYHIESSLQKMMNIQAREETLAGFLDFWPIAINQMKYFQTAEKNPVNHTLKLKICEEVSQKTEFQEEFILAQLEFAAIAPPSFSEIQLKKIMSFESENEVVKILQSYAAQNRIPDDFRNQLLTLQVEKQKNSVVVKDLRGLFPPDIAFAEFAFAHTKSEKLRDFSSYYLGCYYLRKELLWKAKYYLENKKNNSMTDFALANEIAKIDKKLPFISWDNMDADSWFQYGSQLDKNQDIALYCYTRALEIEPQHIQALVALFEIQKKLKNFRFISHIYQKIRHCNRNFQQLTNNGRISNEEVVIFNACMEKFQVNHDQFERMWNAYLKVANSLNQMESELNDSQNKQKYDANWLVYDILDNSNSIVTLKHILSCHLNKRFEYALAHFELSIHYYSQNNSFYIWHYLEAVKIWPLLESLYPHLYLEGRTCDDPELLKNLKCHYLYHDYMVNRLDSEMSPHMVMAYFKCLFENHFIYLLEVAQVNRFIARSDLHPIQKIEALLLVNEYSRASEMINEPMNVDPSVSRIFNWEPTLSGMLIFLQTQIEKYQQIAELMQDEYLKNLYIDKFVKLSEYLEIGADTNQFLPIQFNP